jgi:hypothetical protein
MIMEIKNIMVPGAEHRNLLSEIKIISTYVWSLALGICSVFNAKSISK